MRAARRLVTEMELWKLVWQQVEEFVDRVDGARDQDAAGDARFRALLAAAQVVERERALRNETAPLGDPVIDTPPRPDLTVGLQVDHRIWRVPGTDEAELAVAQLWIEDDEPGDDPVEILPPSDFYDYFVEPSDPAFEASDNGRVTVRMPGYPGLGTSTIFGTALPAATNAIGLRLLKPSIEEDGDKVSLFSKDRRRKATMDVDQADEHVMVWSELTASRRANRAGASEADVNFYGASGSTVAWSPAMALTGLALAAAVIARTPPPLGVSHLGQARDIAEAARGAAGTVNGNATILRSAADALEEAGPRDAGLPGLIRSTADALGPRPELFTAVADSADTLADFLGVPLNLPVPTDFAAARTAAAEGLRAAVETVTAAMAGASADLLNSAPESGALAPEIDETLAERIAYPDGSLRILRALEQGFVRFWPARIRWFRNRYLLTLQLAFLRFRLPFLQGLRALIHGGDTGFPVAGLDLLAAAPTRATRLRLDHPASFMLALREVEAGHILLTSRGRAAAMVVLGVAGDRNRLSLDIAPLRVSIAPVNGAPPTDTPGLIEGGQELLTDLAAPGILTSALRTGEDPTDPRRDGPVETAVILYGQLALLFGWETVERGLSSTPPSYASRSLPDPVAPPLEGVTLHGSAPARAMTLVLRGMGPPFLDLTNPADPVPRVARPGEQLLIRGRAEGEEGGPPGPMRQAALVVDTAYAIKAEAFHRMDKTAAALLSTTPWPSDDMDECLASCAPEDPLIVIVLEQSWQTFELVSDVTLRRDFAGFDLPSLAGGKLLPASVVQQVTGAAPPGPADVDRSAEFAAARGILETWTRFARR